MGEPGNKFAQTAVQLSKNPLGIIALFIVLVYGFASFVTATSNVLTATERAPLIYFLVLFPILVLGLFGWIVIYHPAHLFGPRDFRNEENYVTLVASLTAASIKHPDGAAMDTARLDVHKIAEMVRSVSASVMEVKDVWPANPLGG